MNERTIALVGDENFKKIEKSRVLIAGLGGVGGYVMESLVRAGVGCIGLCDFDIAEESNLNRQILVTRSTLGRKKVELAKERALSINPDIDIVVFDMKLTEDNISNLHLDEWDFVADCIDDTKAKLALIASASNKIISCMGTGNKMDPFSFKICRIEKTEGDPLARSMRKALREQGLGSLPVLYSSETPVSEGAKPIPTISYMPAVAGLEISSYIIKKILAE